MTPPRRILIYRCGTIGDTVVSIPAINAIRQTFPAASLILMTASTSRGGIWADQVLREFGWFDDFLTYEPADVTRPAAVRALIHRVRHVGADLVIHLGSERNSLFRIWRDRLFFATAGVRRFIGSPSRSVTFWGHLKSADAIYPFEVDRLLGAMARHGVPLRGQAAFDLPLTEAHRTRVSGLLEEARLDGRPLVAMCPGAKQSAKRWPEERYGEIGKRLIARAGVNIAIVGGEDEAGVGERIGAGWARDRWVNAARRLSILESAELLRRCILYVGNDTGAMHLAAAVGTRCLAVFAARCPERSWHPYGDNHVVLRRHVPCRNCFLSDCVREGLRCLREIDVEDVWSSCERMLVYQ